MMRRAGTFLVVLVVALGLAAPALAAPYPSPPHDFSHPGTTHVNRPLFSHAGGQADRALLVIYIRWDDVDYPSGFDATTVARRYFGTGFPSTTFPSVGDFFRRLSFNDLFVFPASESQGIAQDGVVQVHYPGTKAQFLASSIPQRNRTLLELADPFFDYSTYDVDGNGRLDNQEIIVNMLEAEPSLPLGQGCGLNSGVAAVTLDGTNLNALQVPLVNTATNLITIIHENGHALTDMADLYGFGAGRLDFAGPTCSLPDTTLFAPNSWTKMHLGWTTPAVVETDGFYDIRRADTTGDSFILYDPADGTNDYFMVENRERTPGTYDQGASDSGLVIWRVNDNSLGVANGLRPIEPMLPDGTTTPTNNYGGSSRDAWDPSDPDTPQRTMAREWADGTPSGVAVRAIGPRGETIRAYFDVPGPGVLVDTYPLDRAGPVRAVAAGSRTIDVPIMNTAESGCDTFFVEPVNLPPGWTMTRGARILCAGETALARTTLTPDAGAAVGTYDIAIRGWSQTNSAVVTTSPLTVEVALRTTRLDLAGVLALAPAGATPTFSARLAPEDDARVGVAGASVTFTLTHEGVVAFTAIATTDTTGTATVTAPPDLPAGTYQLTVETQRVGQFAPATSTVPVVIRPPADLIQDIADQLTAMLPSATPAVRSALLSARDELIGNHGGAARNGALDALLAGNAVAAVTKLGHATSHLLTAQSRGASSSTQLQQIGLTGESIARTELARAQVASPESTTELARIAGLIADGRDQLRTANYDEALASFKQAVVGAASLLR
ncbi:hypothetical protein [Micromonospora sp. MA102]|uniref:hypothetical protein n=1 Tax=Micromonospora sp. MA102 TaxID=2952755 RepID=UPI0021C71611|nr:hypothetical protein [Micromonospora sp. MA102]